MIRDGANVSDNRKRRCKYIPKDTVGPEFSPPNLILYT